MPEQTTPEQAVIAAARLWVAKRTFGPAWEHAEAEDALALAARALDPPADDECAAFGAMIETGARADAEFIAAARTAMPALVAEVGQLRADVDRLTGNAHEVEDELRTAWADLAAARAELAAATTTSAGAWHSVWLHGDWRWLTKNMTTPQREHAAEAVEQHWAAMEADDGTIAHSDETRADLRWWREPASAATDTAGQDGGEQACSHGPEYRCWTCVGDDEFAPYTPAVDGGEQAGQEDGR